MNGERLIELTIDSIRVSVPEGSTILDAARSAEVYIPTLCHLDGVYDVGAAPRYAR